MRVSNAIDCNGLSAAPTLLRIKQALVGRKDKARPLDILVDAACDRENLLRSLGKQVAAVRLLAHPR